MGLISGRLFLSQGGHFLLCPALLFLGLFENTKQNLKNQGTRTVPLVNHAFARATPAIFVIFVVLTGSEQESPCFTGQDAPFSSKSPLLAGDKGTVSKGTVFLAPAKKTPRVS